MSLAEAGSDKDWMLGKVELNESKIVLHGYAGSKIDHLGKEASMPCASQR